MPEILTRAGKGSALGYTEMDANLDRTVVSKTANYTLTSANNREIIECNTNAFTATFPDCATLVATLDTGDYFVDIKNNNSATNNITIARTGTDTFDGATSITLYPYEAIRIAANSGGNGWEIVSYKSSIQGLTPTADNIIVGNSGGTAWEKRTVTQIQTLLEVYPSVRKNKASNTSRASTTTFADDPDLAGWTLDANSIYIVKGILFAYAESNTSSFKCAFQIDQTPQFERISYSMGDSSGTGNVRNVFTAINAARNTSLTGAVYWVIAVDATIQTHATLSSTLDLQWAQGVSHATAAILYKGSYLDVSKLG